MLQLVEQRGGDVNFGRSLVRLLRTEGLVDLGGDGYVATCSATARTLERANALQLKDMFLEAGTLTQEEFDRYLARLDDPDFTLASPMMLSAWGRRPA